MSDIHDGRYPKPATSGCLRMRRLRAGQNLRGGGGLRSADVTTPEALVTRFGLLLEPQLSSILIQSFVRYACYLSFLAQCDPPPSD